MDFLLYCLQLVLTNFLKMQSYSISTLSLYSFLSGHVNIVTDILKLQEDLQLTRPTIMLNLASHMLCNANEN